MKIFVDTNILIDYVCKREPFFLQAKGLFAAAHLGKYNIAISALSIVNTLYIGRKYGSNVLKNKLLSLSQMIEVVDLTANAVISTLPSNWKDYEDALQDATARTTHADCIVTRNKKDFVQSSLPVYTIDELFEIMGF